MSSAFLALVLMQYVVSVKAGLVNHVQGTVNIAEMEMARPGQPVRTGTDGYAEVLLTPGSFLRVGENSSVVLDGVDIESVSLHVVHGDAVIEVDCRLCGIHGAASESGETWAFTICETSPTISSTSSVVRASTLSRSNGSVLDIRRLNQLPSPRSTVTPSRWSIEWMREPNDFSTASTHFSASVTVKLISPEPS